MKKHIKATILIPSYNANDSLLACLSSIRAQEYKNIETIIVDDGSNPPVPKIIESNFADIGVKVIRCSTNMGITEALNLGVDQATGEIIIRLDADDEILPCRITSQVQTIHDYNVDIAFCQMLVDGKANILFYPITHEAVSLCIIYGNPVPHPGAAIRTDILKKVRYTDLDGVKGLEDYYLWARLLKLGCKFMGVHSYGVNYITSETQLSKSVPIDREYLKAKDSIAALNSNSLLAYNKRLSPISILRVLLRLKGQDLKAFKQIAMNDVRLKFSERGSLAVRISLLIDYLILTFSLHKSLRILIAIPTRLATTVLKIIR